MLPYILLPSYINKFISYCTLRPSESKGRFRPCHNIVDVIWNWTVLTLSPREREREKLPLSARRRLIP